MNPSPPRPYMVSVVVPTYRRCASVQRLLLALSVQTLPPQLFEAVVVIDGTDEGTGQMLQNFQAPFLLRSICQPKQGRAAACNTGIQMALGELVVLLDDDMEPDPGLLEAHLAAHNGEKSLGVVGAVPIPEDATSPAVVAYVSEKFNRHLKRISQAGHSFLLRDFYSGNFSVRRSLLLETGGFDEDFQIYGNEDLDLFLRLKAAGVQFVYSTQALATQYYEKDFAGLASDTLAKGRTSVLLARKHPEVVDELRLGANVQGSLQWRLVRGLLLLASRLWPGLPGGLVRLAGWLERRSPSWLPVFYSLVLEVLYWHGARLAGWRRDGVEV